MKEREYNLLHEKWIRVGRFDGTGMELSLLQLFEQAHEVKGFAGELPTQDVALLRFALSILHTVFGRYDVEGNKSALTDVHEEESAEDRWVSLWELQQFPIEVIRDYLLGQEDSFYLFDPVKPFYQVHVPEGFQTQDGLTYVPAEKEIRYFIGDLAESGNKNNLFISRDRVDRLPYAEAARWLLHMNSFDLAPGGAPPKGRKRVNGYKIPWPATLGVLYLEGDNLFETLMMNLTLGDFLDEPKYPQPDWERELPMSSSLLETVEVIMPETSVELFSMRHRLIELQRDEADGMVNGVYVWSGRYMADGIPYTETMSAWRQTKDGVIRSKQHDPNRQMWRDFSSLYSMSEESKEGRPGCIQWISNFRHLTHVRNRFLKVRIVAQDTKNNTAIKDVYTDSLGMSAQLLTQVDDEAWVVRIVQEIHAIDTLAKYVGTLARQVAIASGSDGQSSINNFEKAQEQAYAILDGPFREWIASLRPDEDDIDDACDSWREHAKLLINRYGSSLVESASMQAVVGRTIKELVKSVEREVTYAAPKAELIFKGNLKKYYA